MPDAKSVSQQEQRTPSCGVKQDSGLNELLLVLILQPLQRAALHFRRNVERLQSSKNKACAPWGRLKRSGRRLPAVGRAWRAAPGACRGGMHKNSRITEEHAEL